MNRIYFTIFLFLLFSCSILYAQDSIEGQILSYLDDEPVPSASVKIKGQDMVTKTNEHGFFSLRSTAKTITIIISCVGYEKSAAEIQIPLLSPLILYLRPKNKLLDDVTISTGYQLISKERATGSFTKIDNERFNEQVSTDVLERLEAVANGLAFDRVTNASGRLMVRGLSSIRGPKDPLIVVDNFPYEGDVSNINPNDVESVTILKDAAAASIWGTRAGNGVIVITTKRGKLNQPLSVEFNSSLTVENKPDLGYIKQMSSNDFIDVEQFLFDSGYYDNQINSPDQPVISPIIELLTTKASASGDRKKAIQDQINELRTIDVRDEFREHIYSPGIKQQYALSLSGGSNKVSWRFSSGYDRNTSTLSALYDRVNIGFQNSYKPMAKLALSSSLYYTQSKQRNGKQGYGQISSKGGNLYPYARLFNENGSSLPIPKDYRLNYIDTLAGGQLMDWKYYPGEDYKYMDNSISVNDVVLNFGANYMITEGLQIDLKYQFENQANTGKNLRDVNSYYARDLINNYTQLNTSDGTIEHKVPIGGILDVQDSELKSHMIRGQINLDKSWTVHTLNAIIGGELRNAETDAQSNTHYGYDRNNLNIGNVDYTVPHPLLIAGYSTFIPNSIDLRRTTTRFVSTYFNAAYSYKRKYTFSLSGRRDASNLFGLKINDKWKPLWSAGISWDISKEHFYKISFLPYLKLRATYGFSGNVDPSQTALTTIMYSGSSPYILESTAMFDNYANPDLKWETVKMLNVALDFQTHNQRVSGSFEFYHKRGKDLFGTYPMDYTTGVGSSVVRNVASIQGKGIDVELNSLNIKGPIRWYTNLNFSYYKDEVVDYYLTSLAGSRFLQGSVTISGIENDPIYSVYSYEWAGLDPSTGDPLGFKEGIPSNDYSILTGNETLVTDLNHHGSALPVIFGSLGNTLTWRNFSLTARILYKFNYFFRSNSIDYGALYSSWDGHADFSNRWQKSGDERLTNIPSMVYPAVRKRDAFYKFSEVLVESGDHVRLQYISLGYTLANNLIKNMKINNLKIYLNLSNLGILWRANRKGIDPEYASSGFSIPPSRSISLGLKTNF